MGNRHHFLLLDVIRGISAIFIVLYHYTYRYNDNLFIISSKSEFDWSFEVWWGYGAVSTFFILSGFLTSKLLCSSESGLNCAGKYSINRFCRLYPTFWCGVILTTLFMSIFMKEAIVSIKDFILNLTMLPSLFNAQSVDGAYWTMQREFFFSLIVFLALLTPYKVRKYLLYPGWILCAIWYNSIGVDPEGNGWKLFRIVCMPVFTNCFIAGITAYQVVFNIHERKYYSFLLFTSVISQFLLFPISPNSIFFICTILLLIGVNVMDRILHDIYILPAISWIASISYPLYLIHQMVGIAILKNLHSLGLRSEWIILIPILVALLLAAIIHYIVELPSSHMGKKLAKMIPLKNVQSRSLVVSKN